MLTAKILYFILLIMQIRVLCPESQSFWLVFLGSVLGGGMKIERKRKLRHLRQFLVKMISHRITIEPFAVRKYKLINLNSSFLKSKFSTSSEKFSDPQSLTVRIEMSFHKRRHRISERLNFQSFRTPLFVPGKNLERLSMGISINTISIVVIQGMVYIPSIKFNQKFSFIL